MPVQTQIQQRRGTAASWTSTNPTLAAGEIGFESDTNRFKIGNGSTAWASLSYWVQDPVTTKGDLYTFSTTDARLPVGANGETIVADSSTSTGLRYQADFAAGKNKIINGDFAINQRAFTSTTTSITYGFDRWLMLGVDGTTTYSAQTFTAGAAPVAGYEAINFARLVTTGQTATNAFSFLSQKMEDVRTYANQTVTVSFWAKAATGTPKIAIELDQQFGSGGSTRVATAVSQPTISTSFVRYSATILVPSISGKTIGAGSTLNLNLIVSAGTDFNARTGSLGIQSNTFDIWGVQVEAGSVATAFQTATGTIQGELAACQRYYYRTASNGATTFTTVGNAYSTTNAVLQTRLPVTMRVTPTAVDFSTLQMYSLTSGGQTAITSVSLNAGNGDIMEVIGAVSSGLTSGHIVNLRGNGTGAFLGFSAEL